MKRKTILILALALTFVGQAFPAEPATNDIAFSMGVNVMFGGRYDDLRMCVGSPAGVKGGPIADVMLTTKVWFNDTYAVGLKLPVMRPILFGIAFEMLQFEPEFTFEYKIPINDGLGFVVGGGLGMSFHYGPDYLSDRDNRGESFFATGPFISVLTAVNFEQEHDKLLGIRFFYVPLFSEARPTGTVLGAAVEGHFTFF